MRGKQRVETRNEKGIDRDMVEQFKTCEGGCLVANVTLRYLSIRNSASKKFRQVEVA